MGNQEKGKKGQVICFLVMGLLLASGFFYGCAKAVPTETEEIESESAGEEIQPEEVQHGGALEEKADLEKLTRGEVRITGGELKNYASDIILIYEEPMEQMVCSLTMPQIPESDDAYLYLFARGCYEGEEDLSGKPAASQLKGRECEFSFPYRESYLFEQFIPALLIDGEYVPVGEGVYLSNPEALASNRESYPETDSKKGLMLDPTLLGTDKLTDLGVKHAVYNIPLSAIMGETTDENFPTITYAHRGKNYQFNGAAIEGYDNLFTYLTNLGICSTAIVLNDWNEDYPELIHPEAREQSKDAFYYMFNSAEEEGVHELEAIAGFLAGRYSGEHGIVHNWVIANEINQSKIWNYMDTDDVNYYAQEFEKAFRIFYQAARSHYANARVYFSIDHDWNDNRGKNSKYFNARDVVEAFNKAAAAHGNYDWGIAIHPYPDPLTRVNYWSQQYDKTMDAELLTIMNLSALTDFLRQEEYLDTKGEVRSITITELGFTSSSGEKLQAAAFAYCYLILEENPYVDAFILSRQTDAPEEVVQGLAFGIYEYDHTEKFLKDIFRYIDTDRAGEYTEFMLNILGADSLEEALSWAE